MTIHVRSGGDLQCRHSALFCAIDAAWCDSHARCRTARARTAETSRASVTRHPSQLRIGTEVGKAGPLVDTQHQVQALHGLARATLDQVIER
jgi:hypothetical protein